VPIVSRAIAAERIHVASNKLAVSHADRTALERVAVVQPAHAFAGKLSQQRPAADSVFRLQSQSRLRDLCAFDVLTDISAQLNAQFRALPRPGLVPGDLAKKAARSRLDLHETADSQPCCQRRLVLKPSPVYRDARRLNAYAVLERSTQREYALSLRQPARPLFLFRVLLLACASHLSSA